MKKSYLFAASSLVAIGAFASSAMAQDVETVVVSGSRINLAGYQAPTPVTVVGTEQLYRDAHTDIGDSIRELPSVGQSSSATNGASAGNISAATAGLNTVNLRNLGTNRTLILFDGQRVVQSNNTGITDLSTIPTSLVQRVDVVTGGASAAYGSDALAGVVNIIINKNFDGFKANIEGGDNYNDTLQSYKGEASFGTGFDGDRGRVIVSGSYTDSPNVLYPLQTNWWKPRALVNNPAYTATNGQPQFITASDVGLAQATTGGLITASPKGTGATPLAANALANIQFVGPTGTPTPFVPGNVSGGQLSNGGTAQSAYADLSGLTVAQHSLTLFGYGSYKITSDIKASIQLNFGKATTENASIPATKFANQTITADNAYLDPTIAARMAAGGVPSFTLGTINTNNITNFNNITLGQLSQTFGIPVDLTTRQLMRGTFTLDGTLGDNWTWNAYYQHGLTRIRLHVLNNVLNANFTNAVDAVRVTAANVGTSGLSIGSIACRSTLTAPTNGCQPLDLFGDGVASQAAVNYITYKNDFENIVLNQDVVAASIQGTLPWALPAGPIAVATGAEYRKEGGRITADPLAIAKAFPVGNFVNFDGQYNVEEGFVEVDAPLLKDDFVENLDFNAAGRITSYSTSGLVETYKAGLTSQINDDFRLRTTYSVDIRAPNLSELFSQGVFTSNSAVDPHTGINVPIFNVSKGNPNLAPEVSTTVSGGVVVTPHWVDGLTLSADWYSILIHNAIYTANASTVLQQCNAGVALYCSQLTYNGTAYAGALGQINTAPLNAAAETTSGLDFQADYTTPLYTGKLDTRIIGNYTDEQTRRALGVLSDASNCLGSQCTFSGVPKFRTTISATYTQDAWSATIQSRLIGSAHINTAWTSVNIDNNAVPFVGYLDLRASYKLGDNYTFYGAMDNATNVPPPTIPSTTANAQNAYYFAAVRGDIYSTSGRLYRAGIRITY